MIPDREKDVSNIQSAHTQKQFDILTEIIVFKARQHPNLRRESPCELIVSWMMGQVK
jgi:hypothetical protein